MNASGHGFGIQTSSGTWNSSNAYTTGITNAGAAVGTITFAVPYSAPDRLYYCLLYTSPSPRDRTRSRMPSSA